MSSRSARRACPLHLEVLEERRLLTAVVGRHIFYNNSVWDGSDASANAADDAAIAPDKTAFLSDVLFNVERLTFNATLDSDPRVYGDKIVWQGRGGSDGGTDDEIFYFDGTTIHQLTENTVPDRFPEISALGIAWERGSGTSQEIIFWDGSETQLTNNAVFDGNASLSDQRLSWESGSGTGLEIWSWDGVNPPANISNNAVVDVQPHANGNNTVWVSDSVPNRKVLMHDGTSTSIIGTSNFSIEDPRADGQHVVWESFKAGTANDREIYYYNGTIVQRLTTNTFPDFDPQVSDGHVTWWGGVFNNFQIYHFDGDEVRQISTGIRNQFPQIDGQFVVWQGYDGTDDEIFLWDGYKVTQLTDNNWNDTRPQISGNHIVWQAAIPGDGNSQEIYHTYVEHEKAGPQNVTSYSRGINGIMIDLEDLPAETELTVDDFLFRVGNNNAPHTWAEAPAPSAIAIRPGAGEGGSDRLTITWPDGAIRNTWLQVIVKGNDQTGGFHTNTGLAASDIFYWGNRVGDTFFNTPEAVLVTNVADEIAARNNPGFGLPIDSPYDFNRDSLVNVNDQIIARNNSGFLVRLHLGQIEGAPLAAFSAVAVDETPEDAGIAFGLLVSGQRTAEEQLAASPDRIPHDSARTHSRVPQSTAVLTAGLPIAADGARSLSTTDSEPLEVELADDLLDLLADLTQRRK